MKQETITIPIADYEIIEKGVQLLEKYIIAEQTSLALSALILLKTQISAHKKIK